VSRHHRNRDTTTMPFVRKRSIKRTLPSDPIAAFKAETTGRLDKEGISTTLVESYRDEQGRPRQRVLANLHGEETTLAALAKLAAMREWLHKERDDAAGDVIEAKQFYETVPQQTLHGVKWSAQERKEIDHLMRVRSKLLKRMQQIERDLGVIQRDGAAIKKHCCATPEEIQTAIKAFKKRHDDARNLVLGMEMMQGASLRESRAALRRLQS